MRRYYGKNVIVVDAGDAIQGEVIGSLTEGEAVVDIMNAVGYDYAVPGNHEFDYGMDVFLDAHSHETTEKAVYKNKDNEDVFLTSTGAKFANFGVLTISGDNKSSELINPDNVDIETIS